MTKQKLVKVITKLDMIAFVHRVPAMDVVTEHMVTAYKHQDFEQTLFARVKGLQPSIERATKHLAQMQGVK